MKLEQASTGGIAGILASVVQEPGTYIHTHHHTCTMKPLYNKKDTWGTPLREPSVPYTEVSFIRRVPFQIFHRCLFMKACVCLELVGESDQLPEPTGPSEGQQTIACTTITTKCVLSLQQ